MKKSISKIILNSIKEQNYFLHNYGKYFAFKTGVLLFALFPMSMLFQSFWLKFKQGEIMMGFVVVSLALISLYVLIKFAPSFISKKGLRTDFLNSLREAAYFLGSTEWKVFLSQEKDVISIQIINEEKIEFRYSLLLTADSSKLIEDVSKVIEQVNFK